MNLFDGIFVRPKDLKPPFVEEKKTMVRDGILFIPSFMEKEDSFSGFSLSQHFDEKKPIQCELCSGNGDWVIQKALAYQEYNWVAVEKRFDRVRKIWSKRENFRVQNLFLVCGSAESFIQKYVEFGELSGVFINFPDPWPKARHHKHRLFQKPFMADLAKAIEEKGLLSLVTDDLNFLQDSLPIIMEEFSSKLSEPYYEEVVENYGNSWFENLWRGKGKKIFRASFENGGI